MINCPRCQHENPAGVKFCGECGGRLEAVCPACQRTNPPSNKFCHQCGALLTATGPGTPRLTSLDSHTPKHLVEKILTSKAALEGERKQVTVLFADLKGSMELLADRDPEESRRLLDPVLEHMMDAVHRYEGTVNQVMGDGIMALFGAPLAHEDHAVRACYAALRMQESAKRYAEEAWRAHGVTVQIRVGLNSGEVVVRSIGSDLHMDYTAVGQTTHLAARMEQLARPGTTLITEHTLRLCEEYVRVNALGPTPIKGLTAPLAVYELVGTGSARTRLHVATARGLTRFIGRDAEVEQLREALERAGQGHGQLVTVVGEAGVGKSRLFHEFTRSRCARGWSVLEASSVSYGQATAYLPVITLLREYFGIQDEDDRRQIRNKVIARVLGLDRGLDPLLPPLLALLDLPVEDPGWETLDPRQRREQTLEAVTRLLVLESLAQPLLVVVEDLHWIDSETQAVLGKLVERLASNRMLVLVNHRPEYQHSWGDETAHTRIRVHPLPPESAGALLGALIGGDPSLAPLRDLLLARTDGNPFFLEECVRMLAETGVLAGTRGAYRLARAVDGLEVPATVRTVLAARIDRLPPEAKRLLQVAAVIGESVPLGLLQAIAEVPEGILLSTLAQLQSAEFLDEASRAPQLRYAFKHALTHDVAYTSLLQERRRGLHARIVTALERLPAERRAEHADRLAYHSMRGEVWDKAVGYLREAGTRATRHSAYPEAVRSLDQALEALDRLPGTSETTSLAIDLRLDLRTALTPLAQYRRILDLLREAEALALAAGDDHRLALVVADTSARLRNIGDHAGALEAGRRACEIAARLRDRDLQVEASYRLAQAHFAVGDFTRTVVLLRDAVDALRAEPGPSGSRLPAYLAAWPRAWLALSLANLGHFTEAISQGEDAIRIAEAANHPHSIVEAHAALGRVYLAAGDAERAIALFQPGLAPSRTWNIWDSSVFSGLGYAYVIAGRLDEGLLLLREAVERGQQIDAMGIGHSVRLARLGEGCALAGRLDEAEARARDALDLARRQKERGNEAYALRVLGETGSLGTPPRVESAREWFEQARFLAAQLGMRPLVAHCHLGLGTLYRRAGQREQAREHLTTATTMYREMGMRFYLAQTEAALREMGAS